jgi:adenylate kinase
LFDVVQEREALETRSLPMRQYLVDNVLPLLTKGLLEVGRLRPEDPIDFLAEYLFKNDAKSD